MWSVQAHIAIMTFSTSNSRRVCIYIYLCQTCFLLSLAMDLAMAAR